MPIGDTREPGQDSSGLVAETLRETENLTPEEIKTGSDVLKTEGLHLWQSEKYFNTRDGREERIFLDKTDGKLKLEFPPNDGDRHSPFKTKEITKEEAQLEIAKDIERIKTEIAEAQAEQERINQNIQYLRETENKYKCALVAAGGELNK